MSLAKFYTFVYETYILFEVRLFVHVHVNLGFSEERFLGQLNLPLREFWERSCNSG